jgi:hypothetical protein
MPTKEEYAQVFNKLLGTTIHWEKLSLEDLVQLATLFNHPEIFLEKLGATVKQEMGRRRLVEVGIDVLKDWADKWEGPLAQLVRRIMAEEEAAPEREEAK